MAEIARPKKLSEEKLVIPCPACGAKTRLPLLKLHKGPKCGKCKNDLQATLYQALAPLPLADDVFDALVLASKIPALVVAFSSRDPRSTFAVAHVEELYPLFRGKILFAVADIARCPLFAHRFQIRNVPAFLVLRSGLVIEESHGMRTAGYLKARLDWLTKL